MEKWLQKAHAELTASIIEKAAESGEQFQRAFLNGMLTAISAHLVKVDGPQATYEVFQRLADECARSLVDESRA